LKRLAAALAAALVAATLLAAPAASREIAIERFEADLVVSADGGLEVEETIRFRFDGAWNGIEREIPVEYRTPQGLAYRLDLQLVSIADDQGTTLRHESSRVRHYRRFRIWVPGAADAARTVVIRYRVANALRFFASHDELYWNVTGDTWEMPIGAASARVLLPDAATSLRATAFTGPYGSRARDADVAIDGSTVRVEMTRALDFREGLSVVVGWAPGVVRRPTALENFAGAVAANWPLVIPVFAFIGMFGLWSRIGRDPARGTIAVRYEPPAGLTPAEAGTLLDHRMDSRDITATLVDLAVRGYLSIEETEEEKVLGIFGGGSSYRFHRRRPVAEWSALEAHEREVLEGLFAHGDRESVELARLKNNFYRHLTPMKNGVYGALERRGWYVHRPDRVRAGFMVAGGAITFLSVHAAVFLSPLLGVAPLALGLATALSGLVVLFFGWHMPARTEAGTRALEAVLGFEEFLSRVEADSFERVARTPATFERYLPWAMAFGVEDRWIRLFDDVLTTPPGWYQSPHPGSFHMPSFGRSLGHLSQTASTAMTTSPRSSGGSGFGGGGSSGGGFGGGGGRGF
jgi:uncharacterized membrane protein YgcG